MRHWRVGPVDSSLMLFLVGVRCFVVKVIRNFRYFNHQIKNLQLISHLIACYQILCLDFFLNGVRKVVVIRVIFEIFSTIICNLIVNNLMVLYLLIIYFYVKVVWLINLITFWFFFVIIEIKIIFRLIIFVI